LRQATAKLFSSASTRRGRPPRRACRLEEDLISRRWTLLVAQIGVTVASALLYRTLSRYSFDQITASIRAIPGSHLLAAGGFAAASYVCLTGFDFLALRYVGRCVRYRQAALASFVSLSLGHNIGFAFLSSGAVRYRFYSRWGLGPGEVTKVILFCGITVGLGLMILGGLALLIRSELAIAITGLGSRVVVALGVACLALPATYLAIAAFVQKPLTIATWTLAPPPLRLALGQIVLGPLNFACVAACLHQVVTAVVELPYLGVASVYVIANTTALLSHVPGGLGVLESVIIYLLPEAELIGPLLVFRFVYFLAPLVLGLIAFGMAELAFRRRDGARGGGRAARAQSPASE
jgi:uncharacterized membrane protein YbhN (UPF0104 family)